jgi:hypothetical protein
LTVLVAVCIPAATMMIAAVEMVVAGVVADVEVGGE